jgi:hypothetical protein
MREKSVPKSGDNQPPLDLRGCSSVALAGTGIRLLVPDKEAAKRLSEALNVPSRITAVRQAALRGTRSRGRDPELFVQDDLMVGQTEDGHPIHLLTSILTTRSSWRGGWFLAIVPAEDTTAFREYLGASRAAVTADLRRQRQQHGSKN